MRQEVVLPKWGMTMQDATILEWTVGIGDEVAEGDVIARVESEKVEAEVESPSSGRVAEIAIDAGETIDVGTVIAYLEDDE